MKLNFRYLREWKCLASLNFVVCLIVSLSSVGDYGMSWDEEFRFAGGDSKLAYYGDLFAGKDPDVQTSSYPGLFDLPLALAHEAFPAWGTRSEKGHVWSLCFGLLGLLSVWRMTARIGGERAGFWALLFLATVPRYYGHMFFNPKDIPLAGTYAFGIWALVVFFSRLPKVSWQSVCWIGLAAGLAMSTRIAGFLILCYFGLFVGLYLLYRFTLEQQRLPALIKEVYTWARWGALAGIIGFAVLLIFWPTLHRNPFEAASSSLQTVQSYGWDGLVLMDGQFWEAQNLPFYYIPYWLFVTLPEQLLLLFGLGLAVGILTLAAFVRGRQTIDISSLLTCGILIFSTCFPVAYLLLTDPVLYDGMRHFLFILPPFVCVGALSLEWLMRKAESRGLKVLQYGLPLGAGLAVLVVVIQMVSLHPYQYVYFNQVSGGLPGAYMRDETDYWGLSHQEAGEWLNDYIESVDPAGDRIYKVHQRYSGWMLQAALDPGRFEIWQLREGADFFVSVTRFNLHVSYPEAELLHVVQRQGVPLCFVFKFAQQREGIE